MRDRARILVVDDQESARDFLGRFLVSVGYDVALADSAEAALAEVEARPVDLVLMDLRMPGMDGIEALKRLKARDPALPVVVLTAYATVETAVSAMKLGAFDYLKKPFETEEMEIVVARALEHRRLVEENKSLKAEVADRYRLDNLLGKSAGMTRVFDLVRKVGPSELPVLIVGESGTGKDLVARAIHGLSARADKRFLSINCAAVPETLLESELFGHEKGAFSGADRARPGYFREADGGTLFLDEIGEMSPAQQAKLLRVIETGEMMPVGSEKVVRVDVRLLAATHQDLERLVKEKRFREDLLYRIDTVRVEIPPLRSRKEDIPLLVAHFVERARPTQGAPPRLGAAAMRCLLHYDWPGNVRELEHAIEHAVLVAEGPEITGEDLPAKLRPQSASPAADATWRGAGSYRAARRLFERDFFTALLADAEGNVARAADLAGLHRATFYQKMKRLGLEGADPGEGGTTAGPGDAGPPRQGR